MKDLEVEVEAEAGAEAEAEAEAEVEVLEVEGEEVIIEVIMMEPIHKKMLQHKTLITNKVKIPPINLKHKIKASLPSLRSE